MRTAAQLKPTFDFLAALQKHNNKAWFEAHRAEYEEARQRFADFVDAFIDEFRPVEDFADLSAKDCMFRINRDVRFSKDKSPYKTNLGASIAQGGKHSVRAPYYIHLQPADESMLAGGAYAPTPEQLAAIRSAIDRDPAALKKIVNAKPFVKAFGSLSGERIKTAPKGYERDHPAIELLQYKQIVAAHPLTDKVVFSSNLVAHTVEVFAALKPLLDWLNSILLA